MVVILLAIAQSQTDLLSPENTLRFADHLYDQQDYSAALGEYRRVLFLSDSIPEAVYDRIIECLVNLRRFKEALDELERCSDPRKRQYKKGWLFYHKGDYDSARIYLQKTDSIWEAKARQLIGLSYARDYDFNEAANYLEMPKPAPANRNPLLAGVCALFPGGGHFYAGRISDGIYSLVVVSTATLLAYYYHEREENLKFGISFGAAIFFYAGNIYGGINAVRNYNYYQNETYLKKIIETENRNED